jgi:hypothetical protein
LASLLCNAFSLPVLQDYINVVKTDSDAQTIQNMKKIVAHIEHWNSSLRDMHNREMKV